MLTSHATNSQEEFGPSLQQAIQENYIGRSTDKCPYTCVVWPTILTCDLTKKAGTSAAANLSSSNNWLYSKRTKEPTVYQVNFGGFLCYSPQYMRTGVSCFCQATTQCTVCWRSDMLFTVILTPSQSAGD